MTAKNNSASPSHHPHCRLDIHKADRSPLHLAILERIISGGHRTTDAQEADFFYLPVTSRALKKQLLLMPLLQYVASTWPYWNQTKGARHVIPMEGVCVWLRVRICLHGCVVCVCLRLILHALIALRWGPRAPS